MLFSQAEHAQIVWILRCQISGHKSAHSRKVFLHVSARLIVDTITQTNSPWRRKDVVTVSRRPSYTSRLTRSSFKLMMHGLSPVNLINLITVSWYLISDTCHAWGVPHCVIRRIVEFPSKGNLLFPSFFHQSFSVLVMCVRKYM